MSPLYHKLHWYTMVPEATFNANLDICVRLVDIPGAVVECGVWRGGMSAAFYAVMGHGRHHYLFDSFQGLPPADPEVDGQRAVDFQTTTDPATTFDNCTAPEVHAREAMKAVDAVNFTIIPGWFEDTMPAHAPPFPIALLRIDADWYAPTKLCLETLFDRVPSGGIIILDDYFAWDGCARAVHEFLVARPERLESCSETGLCYINRR